MASVLSHLPEIEGLRVVNSQGLLAAGSNVISKNSINVSDRDYFINLRDNPQDHLEISKPFKGRINGKWELAVARRITKPDGSFGGVAFGIITLENIDKLFSVIDVGKYGAFALRDGNDLGLVARHPEPEGIGSNVGHKKMSKEFLALLDKRKFSGTYNAPSGLDNRMRTWGYRKFGNNLFYVFVGLAHEEILADWRREATYVGCFMGLFSLISIIAGRIIFLGWKRNREADEALRVTDERIRLFFERQIVGMAISDPGKHWLQMNDKWCEILGYERAELENLSWEQLTHPDDLPKNIELFNQILNGKIDNYTITKRFIRKDGSIVVVELSAGCVRNEDGTLNCLLTVMVDITERKLIEEALQLSQINYRILFDTASDAIFIHDLTGNFIDANETAYKRLGYTKAELMALHISQLDSSEFAAKVPERIARIVLDGQAIFETAHLRKDGSVMPVEINTRLLEYQGKQVCYSVVRDITDRKQAEEERHALEKQLLHAQKLESLGVLAGGIAHDFNNILMVIIGNADLALIRINKESPVTENLHRIENAAARAAELAKQMLAYSGKGKFVVENIDLNTLLQEMLHMLEVSISKKAVLRLNPYLPLPSVEADATQMRQIIMNLVINASEAIGDKSGVIAITTGCMDCDRHYLKDVWLDENISEGFYIYLEIADTGCGMDKETLTKLFDPFFTTKFTGRGLGMAAVLGIVRGHKGAIKVYSEPGKGTNFKILIPASSKPAELFNHDSTHDDWTGSGKALLVDDEETVRGIGSEMLKELGFDVITANNGREALEAYKNNPDISFVILDLTMPHMDGEQCFRELRQIKHDIKVIMSSGYNEQEVTQKFVGKGLAGFIQKPYKLSALRDSIMAA